MRGFRSAIRQIATGLDGGGVFNGNANREVITVPFLTGDGFKIRQRACFRARGLSRYLYTDRPIIGYLEAADDLSTVGHGADQLGQAGSFYRPGTNVPGFPQRMLQKIGRKPESIRKMIDLQRAVSGGG